MKKNLLSEAIYGFTTYSFWANLGRIFAFVNSLLIIYFLSVYEFGVYKLIFALIGLAQLFEFSGLDSVISIDILRAVGAKNEKLAARTFFQYTIGKAALSIVVFTTVFFGAEYYISNNYHSSVALIKIAALVLLLFPFINSLKEIFRARSDFSSLYKFELFHELLRFILLLSWLSFHDHDVKSVILVLILSYFITSAIFLFKALPKLKIWSQYITASIFNFDEIISIFRQHGKWGFVNNVFSNMVTNLKPWLIKIFTSTEGVAIYGIAQSFVSHLDSLIGGRRVLGLLASREWGNKERVERIYSKGIKYLNLLGIFAGILGLIGFTVLINLLYPKYGASLPLIYILLIPFLYRGFPAVTSIMLNSAREQKFLLGISVFKIISVVVVNSFLLPLIGVFGAAIDHVFQVIIFTIARYIKLRRVNCNFVVRLKELFIIDEYDKIVLRRLMFYTKSKIRKIVF